MTDSLGNPATPGPVPGQATAILARAANGDMAAAAELLPLVYEHLRAIAGSYFRAQPANHTLQPTALVHEAYMKLVGSPTAWNDQAHFCAVAATAMRQILATHASAKRAAKRDAQRVDLTVDVMPTPTGASAIDLLDLDDALKELAMYNERHSRMVELRFLGGLTVESMAHVLGISESMARREWRAARAWLSNRLS